MVSAVACVDPDGWKIVFVDNEDFLKELDEAAKQPVQTPWTLVLGK